jgi:LPS sulfotransferase NodH
MFHYLPYLSQFIAGSRLGKTPPIRHFDAERVAAFMQCFRGAIFVHIRRRDVFAQAVSMFMAETTDIWEDRSGTPPQQARPPYDKTRLLTYANDLVAESRQWPRLFAHFGINPLCIDYEDAAGCYPNYLSPLLRQLDIPVVSPPPPRRMFKLGNAVNQDYARRLQADYQAQ